RTARQSQLFGIVVLLPIASVFVVACRQSNESVATSFRDRNVGVSILKGSNRDLTHKLLKSRCDGLGPSHAYSPPRRLRPWCPPLRLGRRLPTSQRLGAPPL